MFFLFELLFIAILLYILYTLSKNERFALKNMLPKARAEGTWSGSERRKFRRFPQELEITYTVLKRVPPKNERGKTIDLSEGGIKVLLDEKLHPGTSVDMKITMPGREEAANIVGEVMWTEDAPDAKDQSGRRFFHSGIKFSFMKESAGKPVVDYVRSLSSKQEG